jgi:hypothetical protein
MLGQRLGPCCQQQMNPQFRVRLCFTISAFSKYCVRGEYLYTSCPQSYEKVMRAPIAEVKSRRESRLRLGLADTAHLVIKQHRDFLPATCACSAASHHRLCHQRRARLEHEASSRPNKRLSSKNRTGNAAARLLAETTKLLGSR